MKKNTAASLPLRKQLAKKLISYYDELKTKTDSDIQQSQLSRSKSPNRYEFVDDAARNLSYHDDTHTRLKLLKVKELMTDEVSRSQVDGALEYEDAEYLKTHFSKSISSGLKDGSPLKDQSRFSRGDSIDHLQMEDLMKSKVEEAQRVSMYASGVDVEEENLGGTKDGLFHLDLEHIEIYKDSTDKEKFDRHQRKSKEIRRIQYWAEVEKRKKRGKSSNLLVSKSRTIMADHLLENYNDEPRSDPKRKYPIWTVVRETSHPSYISSNYGFALSEDGKNIEIREGDKVIVNPKTHGVFPPLTGTVYKPSKKDGDCDFVVIDLHNGRYPIQITERKKKRTVQPTNCTLRDSKGDVLGRANLSVCGSDGKPSTIQFCKGVLLNSECDPSIVLVKFIRPNWVSHKGIGGTEENDRVIKEDLGAVATHRVKILTLAPKKDSREDPRMPRQIYLFGKRNVIENHPLFDNEASKSVCENGKDYNGPLQVQAGDTENNNLLWVKKSKITGRDEKLYTPTGDFVHVDLDQKCDYTEINSFLRLMEEVAADRRERVARENDRIKEGLDFRIVDKRGRKLRVKITDDNSEDFQPDASVENVPIDDMDEPEAVYYRLEYDGQKVVPLNVMKRTSHREGSGRKEVFSPQRDLYFNSMEPAEFEKEKGGRLHSEKTKVDSNTKTARGIDGVFNATPGKASKVSAAHQNSSDRYRSGGSSNMQIKMDIAEGKTRTVDLLGDADVYVNQRPSHISRVDELGFKQEKMSEKLKRIEGKAAADIQVYFRYYQRKEKFRQGNEFKLQEIRLRLGNPRTFRKFVAYFLDLPSDISIEDAFEGYSTVLGRKAKLSSSK